MIRSFLALYRLDLGIETAHLLTMNLSLPDQKYPTAEQRARSISASTNGSAPSARFAAPPLRAASRSAVAWPCD